MDLSNDKYEQEIQSWQSMADALREPDRSLFPEMLNLCREYAPAITAHDSRFAGEGLFMALLFMQFKTICWIAGEVARVQRTFTEKADV